MLKARKVLFSKGGKGKSGNANSVTSEGQTSTSHDFSDQEIIGKDEWTLIISLQNET